MPLQGERKLLVTGVTCIVAENLTYTDSKSIAETLNSFFTSIGSTLTKLMPITSQLSQTADQEPEFEFVFQPITENYWLGQN